MAGYPGVGEGWDAMKLLDLYIYDYMKKNNRTHTAEIFARETNIQDLPPAVIDTPEGFLTEWWSIFWDTYSARMQLNSGPEAGSSSSSVQLDNEMYSAYQSIHQEAPVVVDQPVPVGADMDTTMITWQQPAAHLFAANNYQGELRLNPAHSDLNSQLYSRANQWARAQAQINGQACAQAIAQAREAQLQAVASPRNPSSHQLQALMMASQTMQSLPPRGNRHGVSLGRPFTAGTTGNGASVGANQQRLEETGKDKHMMPQRIESICPFGNSTNSTPHQQHNLFSINQQPQSFSISANQMNVHNTPTAKNKVLQGASQPNRTLSGNQFKKVQRNKRRSSTSVYEENSMLGNNGEVDKTENEVVESFLSDTDGADNDTGDSFTTLHRISSVNINGNQGFSFEQVSSFRLSNAKVLCCSFSPDGKYLASAGHDKKVNICNMDSLSHEVSAQGHSNIITDVRFRAVSTVFATSSFDKTVQLWNAPRSKSLLTLHGHVEQAMSVDFHPQKQDLLCSCDGNNEIRLWDANQNDCISIFKAANQNDCISIFKGASRQIRFQPRTGNLLAAASGNVVNLIDIDTKLPLFKLEGHGNDIRAICWDPTGKYLASVSEDRARIWSTVGGGKCLYELVSNGNKFESCTFHPAYNQLLVIGSYQIIDVWNPGKGNKTESIDAHEGIISSAAESPLTDLIASASHDHSVKVWR